MENEKKIVVKEERLVKILADSANNRVYIGLMSLSILIFVSIYIIAAFAVPNTFIKFEGITDCPDSLSFKGYCHYIDLKKTNIYQVHIGHLNEKNQFFTLIGKVMPFYTSTDVEFDMNYQIEIKTVDDYGDENDHTEESKMTNSGIIRVKCKKNEIYCENNEFFLYPEVDHKIYRITVEFNLDDFDEKDVKGVYFEGFTVTEGYTIYSLVLRYLFFAISVVSSIFYLIFYFKLHQDLKTFEHKFIMVLSFVLPIFNNPFYALDIFTPRPFFAVASTFYTVFFISCLILFWVVMLQRIYKEKIRVQTKLVNIFSIFVWIIGLIVLMVAGTIASLCFRFNPAFHVNNQYPISFLVFQIFTIVYMILLCLFLFFCIYKICGEWKQIIWRHKVFLVFSIYFFVVIFILAVTSSFQSYDSNGIKLLILIFMCNFYVILLQIFWRFAKDGLKEYKEFVNRRNIFKKNSEEMKKEYGLNYFDDNFEINIARKEDIDIEKIPLENVQKEKMDVLINSKKEINEDRNKTKRLTKKKFEEDESQFSDKEENNSIERIGSSDGENQYQKFDDEEEDENLKNYENNDNEVIQVKNEDLLKFDTINPKDNPKF
jgi:hypothetical protein